MVIEETGSRRILDPEAAEILETHSWPGNVRQLRNVLQGVKSQVLRGVLEPRHLLSLLRVANGPRHRSEPGATLHDGREVPTSQGPTGEAGTSLRAVEDHALREALRVCEGHKGRAARALGIHRSTLRRKMRELGIQSPS